MASIDLTKFRPNLAAQTDDYDWGKLRYPVLVSPKLDGIRCVTHPTLGPVSRSLKPIPNRYIRTVLSKPEFRWLDGELVVGAMNAPDVFSKSQSGVMTHDGIVDFTYVVFDNFEAGHMCGFGIRIQDAERVVSAAQAIYPEHSVNIQILQHHRVENYEELLRHEEAAIEYGYEGLMIRSLDGKYKFGRSTQIEGGLLKMKRFEDDEAKIIGWEPLLRNENEAKIDALGLQKRGYSKEGKIVDDSMVGRFRVRGVSGSRWAGVEFWIGSGLDESSRMAFREQLRQDGIQPWPVPYMMAYTDFKNPNNPMGKIISYKYQAHGSQDAPRTPIWKGIRHAE